MKITIVWVVTQCSSQKGSRFGGTYHLPLQERRVSQARNQHDAGGKQSMCTGLYDLCLFLVGLLFDPEDVAYVPLKRCDIFELYGVTPYKIALSKYFSLQQSFGFPDGISYF
jgi:hypothetical protein